MKKEEKLKLEILDFIEVNGKTLKEKLGLDDIRLEINPVRLIVVAKDKEIPREEFELDFPVEFQEINIKSVVIPGKPEEEDAVFHHEFSDQAKKIYNIKETVSPLAKEKDAKNKKSYNDWKKRHKVGQ